MSSKLIVFNAKKTHFNECCLLCGAVALAHTSQIGADWGKTGNVIHDTW